MMIKKQIGVLAGAVVAASGANAAITLGTDALAVFNLSGGGSYYQLVDAGTVTGNSLSGGTGFQIDVSAASAALGGIESFALLAIADGGGASGLADYNYAEGLYVDDGGGLVWAGASASPTTNIALGNEINSINSFLANANFGFNAEGSLGDFDGSALVAGYLNFATTNLVQNIYQAGAVASTAASQINITTPSGAQETVYLDGTTFNATAEGGGPVVPVPAAAWLFGSALVGLGVVRRKK